MARALSSAMATVDAGGPVIVGGGLAGLSAALALAPRRCVVVAADTLGTGASTGWAQGGIAAAVGADDDAALHLADTLAAADGLADDAAARAILEQGPAAIARLAGFGVAFDRDAAGAYRLGLEAAHSRRRIVHAEGDGTGRAVLRAIVARVRATPSIRVIEGRVARGIVRDDAGAVAGLLLAGAGGEGAILLRTTDVVLATGGLASLWAHTTNPIGAVGRGLALAAEAGAALGELEFVQFHPTAIDAGRDPMPLASEAIRGEGATLIDENGDRFMLDCGEARGRAELAPRDVVSRAVARHLAAGHRVFLDARTALGARFADHFPSVTALCRDAGIDPVSQPIPIRPAAHYTMGGVVVDADGRSTVDGLHAAGEAAATGLHGANRLASNSLLEAAVTGERVGRLLREADARPPGAIDIAAVGALASAAPATGTGPIRPLMQQGFGVLRDAAGMRAARRSLEALRADPSVDTLALRAATLVADAALSRTESRGAHARTDHPDHAALAIRTTITDHAPAEWSPPHAARHHRRADRRPGAR